MEYRVAIRQCRAKGLVADLCVAIRSAVPKSWIASFSGHNVGIYDHTGTGPLAGPPPSFRVEYNFPIYR